VHALADVTRFDAWGRGDIPAELIEAGISRVEKPGSALGGLFATCCTPTREKLYVSMFRSSGTIHTSLWRLKGSAH